MLGKLLKYEWRSMSKLLLPIHGCVLLLALVSRIYFTLGGGLDTLTNTNSSIINALTLLLIFALAVIISSVVIFTYIYSGYHFYKNVFTDQGYLTNTLPVTPAQLLLSKVLVALLWLLIDIIVVILSSLILAGSKEFFSNFGVFFNALASYAKQTPLFTILLVIAFVIAPFQLIGMLFFSITLGNLSSSHKVLASIGAYVGIYIIQQIFGFIQLIIWGYSNNSILLKANVETTYSFETFINPVLITGLIFNLIIIIGCWVGSKYIITKKLNLQ